MDTLTEAERHSRALTLLRKEWVEGAAATYDAEHALVLCQLHSFGAGALYLYERLRLYKEVLALHMAAGDNVGLLEACGRLAPEEPQVRTPFELWALAAYRVLERGVDREELMSGHM